jgi:hypothetical protein
MCIQVGLYKEKMSIAFTRGIMDDFESAIPKARYSETRINHGSGGGNAIASTAVNTVSE